MIRKFLVLYLYIAALSLIPGCALTGSDPPTVTHPVSDEYTDCRGCHEEGVNGAPKTDHARKDECLSCHAVVMGE